MSMKLPQNFIHGFHSLNEVVSKTNLHNGINLDEFLKALNKMTNEKSLGGIYVKFYKIHYIMVTS